MEGLKRRGREAMKVFMRRKHELIALESICLSIFTFREGVKKNIYFFSSLLLLRGSATPPSPLSSPVDNLDFRYIF